MPTIVILIAVAVLTFCFVQFVDLMRRRDDEFPGRFDKVIWGLAILFANVFGALAYLVCKPRSVPASSTALRAELASTLRQQASGGAAGAG